MDILDLQERCREIRKINEEKRKARKANPPRPPPKPRLPPPPPPGKWDFLKDYPGQRLSKEQFHKRFNEYRQQQDAARYAHTGLYEERATPRQTPWRMRSKRRP